MDPILGTITIFAGTYAPKGWEFCNGQLLSIQQNSALFSLLGVTYGGNGTTNFALPDLRGRAPIHSGYSTGPGLSPHQPGEMSGFEAVSLMPNNLPPHNHTMMVASGTPASSRPSGDPIGAGTFYVDNATPSVPLHPATIGVTGTAAPVNIMQPYLAMNYIIATEGIYPSRP
jgi:microcystin-dependent protein